jgi:type II secretory pathway component PulK
VRMHARMNNKGLILVAVLWIVVLMTSVVAIVGQTSRLNMKVSTAALDETRCRWACRAGTEMAIALLNDDVRATDCLMDLWSDNDEDFNNVSLERCQYSVRVTDEAGKLNINTATKEQLMGLSYMESHIADAILDWRDGDANPRAEGAEVGYYENLPFPYTIRNGPLKTIRELLQVKGMTKEFLYGEDSNLNGQLDYTEMDGEVSLPIDNGDDRLDKGWIAHLSCYSYEKNVDAQGAGRININEADEQRLQDGLGLSRGQAQWIVQNRGGGFESVAHLLNNNSPKKAPESSGNSDDNPQPMDRQTFGQIVDKITISGEAKIPGKVNINTAPKEVLVALLGGNEQADQLAQSILSERSGRLYGFDTIAALLSVPSMTLSKFKSIANQITVRSDVFTIRCFATAEVSGAGLQTECVVDRGASPCTILYWYQGANY